MAETAGEMQAERTGEAAKSLQCCRTGEPVALTDRKGRIIMRSQLMRVAIYGNLRPRKTIR
jgi:hypothetical protein